jgi:hypothetical protein
MPRETDLTRVVELCVEHHPDPAAALEAACIAVGLPGASEMERQRARIEATLDFQVFPDDFPELKIYLTLVAMVASLTKTSPDERPPGSPS